MNTKSEFLYRLWAITTIFLVITTVNGLSLTPASAADRVYLRTSSGIGESRVVGHVEEFTGEDLVLRHPSGRLQTFKSDRVLRVESEWSAPHQLALASFQRRKYQDALDAHQDAG